MPDDSNPPPLSELFRRWVFRRFGVVGLLGLAVVSAVFVGWWQWDTISTRRGVAPLVDYLTRASIPQADPARFSVLVARLENDSSHEHAQLVRGLLAEFKGVQILALDRTIPVASVGPEEGERAGHAKARTYLAQSGASVLIWGTVLRYGGQSRPQLYMTTTHGPPGQPKQYTIETATEFRLPAVFWDDLAKILRVLVVSRHQEFYAKSGHYMADQLPPFITQVQALLAASAERPGWDADARGGTRVILADALTVFGDQSGKNEPLIEAVAVYVAPLTERTRERVPLQWAATQNNLGAALWTLGEREGSTERLKEAVTAFRAALKVFKTFQTSSYADITKANLRTAEALLHERQN